MEPIKHFYYYCDLAGFTRCGHSFHPRHAKTAGLGDPGFDVMAALRAVSSITPIVKMLPAAW
jgi:hypothetical protein